MTQTTQRITVWVTGMVSYKCTNMERASEILYSVNSLRRGRGLGFSLRLS